MSIDGINRNLYINAYNSNMKNNTNINKVNKVQETDRIEISSLGKSLTDYSLDTSIDNSKKIADIKNRIESGTYNVDARLTAKSLLNAMKESKS